MTKSLVVASGSVWRIVAGIGVRRGRSSQPARRYRYRRGFGFHREGHRSKKFVLDGHVANKLIVAARSAGAAGDSDGVTWY